MTVAVAQKKPHRSTTGQKPGSGIRSTRKGQTRARTGHSEQPPEMQEAEKALVKKYKHIQIVPGSLQPAGARKSHGDKRTVLVRYSCGCQRTLATSDLWQCKTCKTHSEK